MLTDLARNRTDLPATRSIRLPKKKQTASGEEIRLSSASQYSPPPGPKAPPAAQLAGAFGTPPPGSGPPETPSRALPRVAHRRLEPDPGVQWGSRLGADAPAPHGHSRRGGAVRRGPPHRLLFLAGRRPGRRPTEGHLALVTIGHGHWPYDFDSFPSSSEPPPAPLRDRIYRTSLMGHWAGPAPAGAVAGGEGKAAASGVHSPGLRAASRRRTASDTAATMRSWIPRAVRRRTPLRSAASVRISTRLRVSTRQHRRPVRALLVPRRQKRLKSVFGH